jgi:hypothetical protein
MAFALMTPFPTDGSLEDLCRIERTSMAPYLAYLRKKYGELYRLPQS